MSSSTSPPGTDSSPVVDIEDFVVESSVGWRNGSWQASPPVQYRQRDVGGISGGEGVDGPGGGGRSSFEVSVPQQRGDEQNERGHLSLAKWPLGGEPNVVNFVESVHRRGVCKKSNECRFFRKKDWRAYFRDSE